MRDIKSHAELDPLLVNGIALSIHDAFGGTITPDDALKHMHGERLLVAHPRLANGEVSDEVAGFTSASIIAPNIELEDDSQLTQPGAYFAAAAIRDAYKGTGLYPRFVNERFQFALDQDVDFLYTRTQNPRVLSGIGRRFEYALEKGEIRRYKLQIELSRCAYGHMLTKEKPETAGTIFDLLNYEVGDAYVLTWFFDR